MMIQSDLNHIFQRGIPPTSIQIYDWLVVWNMAFIFPFHIWDVILPFDELIFFKMV